MSCTSPSVIRIAPPTRSGGASASAPRSAANSLVPSVSDSSRDGFDDAQIDVAERVEPRLRARRAPCRSAAAARRCPGWRSGRRRRRRCPSAGAGPPARDWDRSRPSSSSAKRERAQPRAARRRRQTSATETASAAAASAYERTAREERERRRSTRRSTGEPFQDVLGVDLVGLVIAGERVHHEIDAAAQGELALARPAGNERIERSARRRRSPRPRQDRRRR